jgi:hypothetical protein
MVKEQPFMTRLRDIQESVISEMTRVGEEAGAIDLSQGMPKVDSPARPAKVAVRAIQGGDNQSEHLGRARHHARALWLCKREQTLHEAAKQLRLLTENASRGPVTLRPLLSLPSAKTWRSNDGF